jgi:lactate racemase
MAELSLPWGNQQLPISLPESWTLLQVANPELKPAPADWPDRLAAALLQPGTGLPLERLLSARRNGKIAIVIEDVTRHSPIEQILDVLVRELRHAEIPDANVRIVFAVGTHPAMTDAQAAQKLGPYAGQFAWHSNPWQQRDAHVHVGKVGKIDFCLDPAVADADLRILISSVSPHLQAGFGGGYKMFFPGCASRETIRVIHRLGLGRTARQLVGTDTDHNPMRQAIDAGGELVDARYGKTFSIQYLLDEEDKPSLLAAGEVLPTHRMLAKQCSVACGVVPTAPADVLITNACPRDHDLLQSFKCIANTLWAARPNGIVICVTRCEAALNGMKPIRWPLSPAGTRKAIRLLGPENLASLVTRLVPRLAGDAAFFIRQATQILNRNVLYMVSPPLAKHAVKFPGLYIFGTVEEALAAAQKHFEGRPQRVTIFPSGGTTFPVPTISPLITQTES